MTVILHLVPFADVLALGPAEPITNASLERDGFIHCTDEPDVLLRVANSFYSEQPGDFVTLHVDVDRLTSPCVWEDPADVGETDETFAPQFPHVYGPIDRDAVLAMQRMIRDDSGAFIGYGGKENPPST